MTNSPACRSCARRLGTHCGQIAPTVRNHCHSKRLRSTGASQTWGTFSLGSARLRQYCLLPTAMRQISDETPPDKGCAQNGSPCEMRPMRRSVSPIISRVSGPAEQPEGIIDQLSFPKNYIRASWRCNPDKIEMATIAPKRCAAGPKGASLPKAKWVRTSLSLLPRQVSSAAVHNCHEL